MVWNEVIFMSEFEVRTNSPNDYYVNILHGVWKSPKSLIQYILRALSGQMFIENAKNCPFWKPVACGQTVLPDF